MANELAGKVIVVTGAARGLGRAMAGGLTSAGAQVIGVDLPGQAELQAAAAELGGNFHPMEADITDEAACAGIAEIAARRFGGATGLINNAGVGMQFINPTFASKPTRFWELTPQQWRNGLETNSTTQFMMARALVPQMMARGWGRIVNVTTSYGTMIAPGFSPYGPSKAAMEAAAAIWAKDLAGTGVTVNILIPGGPANTRMITDHDKWPEREKLVQPPQMIAPAVWLMSDRSNGVTSRRFVAANWNPGLEPATAAMLSSTPAAW